MQAATAADGSGGRESESRLVQSHERLIRYTAIPFVGHGIALEDLMQEGKIALLEAARRWDPSQGVKLWTYARKFVLGGIFRCVAREINEPSRDLLAPAEENEDGDVVARLLSEGPTPEEIAQLGEDLVILEEEIDALNEGERQVLWKVFGDDLTLRDIAVADGTHHSTPQRIYRGAIEKLRNRMEARA